MSKKIAHTEISEDDRNLFRDAISHIRPIKHDKLTLRKKPSAVRKRTSVDSEPTTPSFTISDYQTEKTVSSDDHLYFAKTGLSKQQIRDLKQGRIRITARLDLHGFNAESARDELIRFIDQKLQEHHRFLCVIHGKGHGDKPILKNKLNNWLRQIDPVLAFCTAQPRDGGTGATYILLKSGRK